VFSATLPRALRITEIDFHIRGHGKGFVLGHLQSAIPGQRKQRDLYSLRSRQQTVQLDARNAVNQLEQAKLSIAAGKIARDLARKNLEAEQRKYELGSETIFFVLDAQTQLQQAESSYVQSLISYQRAVTAVQRATGELLDRFRVQIKEPY
jgi:outer membrane protein